MERKTINVGFRGEVDSLEDIQEGNILHHETFNSTSLITKVNKDKTFMTSGRRGGWGRKWINEFKHYQTGEEGNYKLTTSIMDSNRVYYLHRSFDRPKYDALDKQLQEAGI